MRERGSVRKWTDDVDIKTFFDHEAECYSRVLWNRYGTDQILAGARGSQLCQHGSPAELHISAVRLLHAQCFDRLTALYAVMQQCSYCLLYSLE